MLPSRENTDGVPHQCSRADYWLLRGFDRPLLRLRRVVAAADLDSKDAFFIARVVELSLLVARCLCLCLSISLRYDESRNDVQEC